MSERIKSFTYFDFLKRYDHGYLFHVIVTYLILMNAGIVSQFNIEDLEGKSIDLSNFNAKPLNIESGSRKKYVLRKDITSVHANIRPIVHNGIDGSTGVGGDFSGTFVISEKIDVKIVSPAASLPVSRYLDNM